MLSCCYFPQETMTGKLTFILRCVCQCFNVIHLCWQNKWWNLRLVTTNLGSFNIHFWWVVLMEIISRKKKKHTQEQYGKFLTLFFLEHLNEPLSQILESDCTHNQFSLLEHRPRVRILPHLLYQREKCRAIEKIKKLFRGISKSIRSSVQPMATCRGGHWRPWTQFYSI